MFNDMANTKRHTSIYSFLEQSGVLESNDPVLIKKARQAYWRSYHRDYKREQRDNLYEHTIALSKQENALIQREADRHNKTISLLIKETAFAYLGKHYLAIVSETLGMVEQQLSHIRTILENFGEKHEVMKAAVRALDSIDAKLIQNMHPASLEDELRKALNERPHYLFTLKKLIEEYDYQK